MDASDYENDLSDRLDALLESGMTMQAFAAGARVTRPWIIAWRQNKVANPGIYTLDALRERIEELEREGST